MRKLAALLTGLNCLCFFLYSHAQEEDRPWMVGFFGGVINYQGDLQPSSFTFDHSSAAFAITIRKPLGRWLSFKSGLAVGSLQSTDRNNRDYLKARNLSFHTTIKQIDAGIELNLLDLATKNFSPYVYGGVALFQFNPWTKDQDGNKIFLHPLSTEGQGLDEYPDRKPYKLCQPAIAFGGGIRISLADDLNIGIEFSQRKSFTDYIDDVSTSYVDLDALLNARGPKAVELAYRGDEIPGGSSYPHDGVQRGTPSEMDWYYYVGFTIETRFSFFGNIVKLFNGNNASLIYTRCPRSN